jgi:hypothetical protein
VKLIGDVLKNVRRPFNVENWSVAEKQSENRAAGRLAEASRQLN